MKKNFIYGLITVLFLISGCGTGDYMNRYSGEDSFIDALQQKYEISVEVLSMDEYLGTDIFNRGYYHAAVQENGTGVTFDAYLARDTGELKDTYARHIYEEKIEEALQEALGELLQEERCSYEVMYFSESGFWVEEDQFLEYLKESGTYASIELNMTGQGVESAAETTYELCKELQRVGIHFRIHCSYQGNRIRIVDDNYEELESYEELLEQFEGTY